MGISLSDPPTTKASSPRRRSATRRGLTVHVNASDPDAVAITAAGQLDIYTMARLRDRLNRHDLDVEDVVLDVSRVTLIDSSGLGTLLSFANRARHGGRRLALVCTSELADVLRITRLADAFDLTIVDPA